MTTIKLTIEKDNSWDCEGESLKEAAFEWKTDGSALTCEAIARSIVKALRVFGRVPVSAVPFGEAFLSGDVTREEYDEERSKNSQDHNRNQAEILKLYYAMGTKDSFTSDELREIFTGWFGGRNESDTSI